MEVICISGDQNVFILFVMIYSTGVLRHLWRIAFTVLKNVLSIFMCESNEK